jgi:hypothetical protein
MKTRHASTRLLAALAMVSLASRASAGPTPAQVCQSAKNKEAGKYDACRQNAEAGLATSGDNVKYTAALGKCLTKYQLNWAAAEAKAVARGGACPSVGDQAAIQGAIDGYTTNIATALGGGVLQDCPADLAACQSDLATCEAAPEGQLELNAEENLQQELRDPPTAPARRSALSPAA